MKISAADILKNLVNPDGTPIMPPGSLVYLSTDDPKGTYLFDTVLILPHSAFFFILRHILSYCIISCLTLFYVFISHLFSFYSILFYLNSSLFCITFPLFFSSLIFSNLSHPIWQFYRHLCQLLRGEERLSKTPTSQTGWMSRWRKYTERTYICILFSEMCVL